MVRMQIHPARATARRRARAALTTRRQLAAFCLSLCLAAGAAAQTDEDLALLAGQAGVPPNVMLLFDTSGSMNNVAWHEDFDMKVFWDKLPDGSQSPSAQCSIGSVPTIQQPNGDCPDSRASNGSCPDTEANESSGTTISCPQSILPAGCAGWPAGYCTTGWSDVRLTLPDYSQAFSENTRWSRNYLHWYITQTSLSGGPFFPIPDQTRTQVGQQAFRELINDVNPDFPAGGYDENVRFGLAVFHQDNGGYVTVPIGSNNKGQLLAAIDQLDASGFTPLSEALVDMGRYFVGEHQNLGSYPRYDRNTSNGGVTASPPPSPINPALTCQSNFVVLVTDGQPTQDENDHYGTAFATTIGDYDGDGNEAVTGNNGSTDYLDDVAGYLAQEDLIADSIMASRNSIVTYTIGFTVDFPLLKDAALNGKGEYYTTASASELASQLKQTLQSIISRSATFTAASVPSSRTQFGDGFYRGFFQPLEDEPFWPGHLEAYQINEDLQIVGRDGQEAIDPATGEFREPRQPLWDVAHKLAGTAGELAHPPRNLYTTGSVGRIDFTAASTTAGDLAIGAADLGLYPNDPNTPFASTEDLADAIVRYVRGEDAFDDDRDGSTSETRPTVLGDIFHSTPVIVGAPPPHHLVEDGFGPVTDPNSFFGQFALRDHKLYVGANDGMLHAINAGIIANGPSGPFLDHTEAANGGTGGQEAFGYVPGLLLPKLKEIPLQTLNNKSFFVDGDPAVADAWLASSSLDVSKEAGEWATVLLAGMRRGGDGYLALDVTDPKATSGPHGPYPRLLWEFADPTEPLGETWSKPVIGRVRVKGGPGGDYCSSGVSPAPDCKEQWVAVFAGGYRQEGDGVLPSFAGPADAGWTADSKAIFVVSLETGQVLARAAYDSADPVLSSMIYSLPSNPAVLDIDFDGFLDLIYVGDTGGQLWKWDISEIGEKDSSGLVTNWEAGVLFRAPVAANGHHRSLFFPPSASFVDGALLLSFGTGERTDLGYATDPAIDDRNRFYVMEDPVPTGPGSIPATAYTEGDLTRLNGLLEDPDTTDLGFYLVAEPHEKFITNHQAFAGHLITASFIPDASGPAACNGGGGTSFLYVFELDRGGGFFDDDPSLPPDETRRLKLGTGAPTDPSIATSYTSASAGEDEQSGTRIIIQTSGGGVASVEGPGGDQAPVKIVFWRQQL